MVSCESRLTDDPSASIEFSVDTLSFDTVFTNAGSATRSVIIRNPGKRAVEIRSVGMQSGNSFRINLDGEQELSRMQHLRIDGGDSLFLFVRATIDPADRSNPLLVEDKVVFEVGNHAKQLTLQAYGWDVELIDSLLIVGDTLMEGRKPYLVRNYILVDSTATLRIAPGARFYMHDDAQLACYGGFIAPGTLEAPILFAPDRLDNIYEGIPYSYVGGKWNGIYLVEPDTAYLSHVEVISGNVGLYVQGSGREHLTLLDSRIHNMSLYGIVLQQVDALVANTEISNCAQYCAYLSGGRYDLIHTTIASYFNSTYYAIQTTIRQDSISPLYINNLSKHRKPTEVHLLNSVLAGARKNCLMLATPLPQYYAGELAYSYLQTDSIKAAYAHDIVYPTPVQPYAAAKANPVFVCTYYGDKEQYYDFTLDSLSPARNIADSLTALHYPLDRRGRNRLEDGRPDAGCYEY